ncbi:MAG TPA: hypothetical protein VFU32_13780, partial [Ktedonobacterales bacterium]|nr:hypothetical protein [Ktedonobacterales bacterium]
TLPLSALNGKMTLPSLGNGNRASPQPPAAQQEPPTIPLPTVQGGLLEYASRREPPAQTPAPAAPKTTLRPPEPPVEAKVSSLSILEQLAYGNHPNNGSVEQAPARDEAAPAPLEQAAPEPPGDVRQLQQVLESFVEQVGPACIATALVRTDGSLVADYVGRRNQEQELNSPAYHLAHVMQSSLRALLMGGWGDLEETMITGSTHLVVLRRLGRPEKGVFHVAVLERSGNPGLCRVRMRGSESALLQLL